MPRVIHFEITADEPERALKFYEEVFGWKTQRWSGGEQTYWLKNTGTDGPGFTAASWAASRDFRPSSIPLASNPWTNL